MVLLPTAALTLLVYRRLRQVKSLEQAQSRQVVRAAQLAWWFRHGCSQLGRFVGPRFVAQLDFESAVEWEVHRRSGLQRRVPEARMSAAQLVTGWAMSLRVTALRVEVTWGVPLRVTAVSVEATWGKPARLIPRVV
jgi:hypothetical protein